MKLAETRQENEGIAAWRDGNLETLDMIGKGDYLGVKYDFLRT